MKHFSPEGNVEKAFENCDEHFEGMIPVLRAIIEEIKSNQSADYLEGLSTRLQTETENSPAKESSPYDVGEYDARKKVLTYLDHVDGAYFKIDDLVAQLEEDVRKIEAVVR